MILAPNGMLLDRTTQPMSAHQLSWFIHADALLQHAAHLWTLRLRLFCRRCWAKKLKDDIRVTFNDTTQTYHVACECATVAGQLPRADVKQIGDTDALLVKLGWSFCCTGRCASSDGMGDGVEGDNDPYGTQFVIRCGCTERIYVAPTTGHA